MALSKLGPQGPIDVANVAARLTAGKITSMLLPLQHVTTVKKQLG